MADPALLFIPDISGFTRFVTRTEVQHANHIISELLGVILESNDLGLHVSEVEGDAVLFYRRGGPPALPDLMRQIRRTFVDFHHFLKVIERDRVCQCGACSTASGLTLKFVAHYGTLDEVRVRDFLKLMGRDVILAHRLLKNEVPGNEYALLTQAYLDAQSGASSAGTPALASVVGMPLRGDDPLEFHPHTETLEDFGLVTARYAPLTPLLASVPDPVERSALDVRSDSALRVEIAAPAALVHEAIVDFPHRLQWTPGLRDSVSDLPMNRVGASHTCVFDGFEVHLITVDHQASPQRYHYAESGEIAGITLVTDYKIEQRGDATTLLVSSTQGGDGGARGLGGLVRSLKARFLLWNTRRAISRSLDCLKPYCEKLHAERQQPHRPAAESTLQG